MAANKSVVSWIQSLFDSQKWQEAAQESSLIRWWLSKCQNYDKKFVQMWLFNRSTFLIVAEKSSKFVISIFKDFDLFTIGRCLPKRRSIRSPLSPRIEDREPIFLRTLLKFILRVELSRDDKYLDFIAPLCLVIFGSSRTSRRPKMIAVSKKVDWFFRCGAQFVSEPSVQFSWLNMKSRHRIKPLLVLSAYMSCSSSPSSLLRCVVGKKQKLTAERRSSHMRKIFKYSTLWDLHT